MRPFSPARRHRARRAGSLSSARTAALLGFLPVAAASADARAAEATGVTESSTSTPPAGGTDASVQGRAAPPGPIRLPVRTASATRREGAVAIDGRLDEPAWRAASPQNTFWQREPHEGGASRFSTEFRVLFDDRAIYVGVRAFDPEPALIRGLLTRRDVDSSSDWISIKIDSYHDRRTAFGFSVNPAGVQRDVFHFNDVEQDPSWDAVWESGTVTDGEGWTAELRIPYSQLRFASAVEQSWGLQVLRRVQRTQELSVWAPWPKETFQEVSLYGTMVGIRGIEANRRLELLPYAVGGAKLFSPDSADPILDGHDAVTGLGLDLKVGLGSGFTLSGTVNPDFGQVEADPSQLNLSAQEVFLQEKRPFFVEGTDIFRFALGGGGDGVIETLFYTRRIGAAPHGDPDDYGDFSNTPDSTTIYSAAKVSGKTASGWSVGLLDAVTGQEDALIASEGDNPADSERVILEPLTNYAVARVRKDLREGRTTLGAAVTAVHRSLEGTKLDWLHDQAYTAGVEGVHRFWDEHWTADLRLAGSYVHGSAEALDETQTSSVHYFQRPDADHLDYDPNRTSLTGASMLWSFGKTAGGHWRITTGGDARTPGFEANDIGFQRGSDYFSQWFWTQYREDRPGDLLRSHATNFNVWRVWDTSPRHLFTGGNVSGQATFLNYWGVGGGFGIDFNVQDPGGLRGGPLLRRDPVYNLWFNAWSDARRTVNATLNGWGWVAPASGSRGGGLTPLVTVQALSNLDLAIGPSLTAQLNDNQYVDEVDDTAGDPHYVLGRLRQVTAALTLRASYTFSPRMGLQLYAQPFVSTGRYNEYKEATSPQADRYDDRYTIFRADQVMDDAEGFRTVDTNGDGAGDFEFELADFNFRELRSNLVFRWEYRPGSALFLIWSHGRTSESEKPDGRFALSDDVSALADETGEHVFLAKLNYWLGL
jgi:hypothetical protein